MSGTVLLERRVLCLLPGPLTPYHAGVSVERLSWITGVPEDAVLRVLRGLEAEGRTTYRTRGWGRL